jgi:hypothetical protein
MLSVTYEPLLLSVFMLNVVMLSVIMLRVVMLNVVMLSLVAPYGQTTYQFIEVPESHSKDSSYKGRHGRLKKSSVFGFGGL